MLTLDEIRNVEFSRGRGYRAEEVDDFIDACVETVDQLIREKEELAQKMKVLADKVIEYRNDEDSIRAALLNAQRAGDAALREAEAKAAEVVRQAEQEAANIHTVALAKIDAEKRELERIQHEVEAFRARLMELYKEHLALIGMLPVPDKAPAKEEAPAEEAPAAEVPAEEPVAEATEEAVEEVAEEEDDTIVVVDPVEDEVVTPAEGEEELRPVSRFADLKFGNDYDIHTDEDGDEDRPKRSPFKKRK